jgi:hypothetical protein
MPARYRADFRGKAFPSEEVPFLGAKATTCDAELP